METRAKMMGNGWVFQTGSKDEKLPNCSEVLLE